MTNAKPRGKPFRLVGTYDNEDTLLFSQGTKNFINKTPCAFCHLLKPMVYRFATAKKGQAIEFGTDIFCSVDCYRKHDQMPLNRPLAPEQS